jgi:hypothetical protein
MRTPRTAPTNGAKRAWKTSFLTKPGEPYAVRSANIRGCSTYFALTALQVRKNQALVACPLSCGRRSQSTFHGPQHLPLTKSPQEVEKAARIMRFEMSTFDLLYQIGIRNHATNFGAIDHDRAGFFFPASQSACEKPCFVSFRSIIPPAKFQISDSDIRLRPACNDEAIKPNRRNRCSKCFADFSEITV